MQRRGWPLGLLVSHTMSPLRPFKRTMISTRSPMEISIPLPRFTGLSSSYMHGRQYNPLGGILDVQELTGRQAVSSELDRRAFVSATSTHFFISAGITCDDRRSKLSPGP